MHQGQSNMMRNDAEIAVGRKPTDWICPGTQVFHSGSVHNLTSDTAELRSPGAAPTIADHRQRQETRRPLCIPARLRRAPRV